MGHHALCTLAQSHLLLVLVSINYIEHYGLLRQRLDSGRYERVNPTTRGIQLPHWPNRVVRIDPPQRHHYKSAKKYQVLNSHEESPTLPLGYPASITLSLVPPLWFVVMNPRVPAQMSWPMTDAKVDS